MNTYTFLKTLHIISAMLLFGTGLGTAFYLWMAYRSRDIYALRITARNVILADWIFTAPAVIIQATTGILLMDHLGWSFASLWFVTVISLFLFIGACWIPVVVLQYRIRDIAMQSSSFELLPVRCHQLMYVWVCLGVPAFSAVLLLFALMVYKPWLGESF
ncbi:MAG TPA: DUF2269 domain-containing protein [Gammaproteobacteria bacterium]|nr:DUF2269 domain-containing protein [Gammaproteobacteria bacterium]